MRILYLNIYQGPDLILQRHIHQNRALGGSRKIELVSRALQRRGHEVVILSGGIPAERSGRYYPAFDSTTTETRVLYATGLDVRAISYGVAVLSASRRLIREIRSRPYDAVLVYNVDEFPWAVTQACWPWIRHLPLVLQYEDGVDVASRGIGDVRQFMWKRMERWFAKRLSGALCVNATLAERLGQSNSYVFSGAVDDILCSRGRERTPPLAGTPPYLAAYCGSLIPGKGVDLIIRIAAQFRGLVRFAITGAGPLEAEFAAAAAQCGGDVELLGCLDRPDLIRLLTTADILIDPHEPEPSGGILPFKLVEYLAAGGIVITTKAGNHIGPLYTHCEVIVPTRKSLADGIERVLANPRPAVVRAEAGQRWAVANYAEGPVGQAVEQVLSAAVGTR